MALSDGLVSYWKLSDDGSWADSKGSNTLTEGGTVGTRAPPMGPLPAAAYAEFDDNAANNLSIIDISQTGLDPDDDFSMSFWMVVDDVDTDHSPVSKFGTAAGADPRYIVFIQASDDKLRFIVRNSASGNSSANTSDTITPGALIHVVVTYDNAGAHKVFLNGEEKANVPAVGGDQTGNQQTFYVGRTAVGGTERPFDGIVGELAFWGRALSDDEAELLWREGNGNFYDNLTADAFDSEIEEPPEPENFSTNVLVGPPMTLEAALFHAREKRRGRLDPFFNLQRTHLFGVTESDIDTDGVFGARNRPITFRTAIRITGAAASGLVFEFGDDTAGAKLGVDSGTFYLAAGNADELQTDGVDGSVVNARLDENGALLRLTVAIDPGDGKVRLWVDDNIVLRLNGGEAFASGVWTSTNNGSIGAAHAGAASTQRFAPPTINGAPSDFDMVAPFEVAVGQLPRQFD